MVVVVGYSTYYPDSFASNKKHAQFFNLLRYAFYFISAAQRTWQWWSSTPPFLVQWSPKLVHISILWCLKQWHRRNWLVRSQKSRILKKVGCCFVVVVFVLSLFSNHFCLAFHNVSHTGWASIIKGKILYVWLLCDFFPYLTLVVMVGRSSMRNRRWESCGGCCMLLVVVTISMYCSSSIIIFSLCFKLKKRAEWWVQLILRHRFKKLIRS